jgi:hypothetical protein
MVFTNYLRHVVVWNIWHCYIWDQLVWKFGSTKYLGSTFELEGNESFHFKTLLETCTLDFICVHVFVTMFITRTSRHVNFTSMVLGLFGIGLVTNPLLVIPFRINLFQNPQFSQHWSFVIDFVLVIDVRWDNDLHHANKFQNGNMVG